MIPLAIIPLATAILRVIEQHQQLILAAPPELRDRYLARLDKWESFWEKLAEPLYKAVVRESESES